MFFRKLMKLLMTLLTIAIALAVVYIYVKQPVRYVPGDDFVFAQPTGKILSSGDKVVIVETKEYNMFTPIIRAVKPQVAYNAEIIAGPYGKITPINADDDYKVVLGEQKAEVHIENLTQEYLEEEYVVRPIDNYGNNSGSDNIVNKNEVLGFIITENN